MSHKLRELLEAGDRFTILRNGEVVAHFQDMSKVAAEDLGPYMLGVQREEAVSGKVSA